jgi:hypothetical protein
MHSHAVAPSGDERGPVAGTGRFTQRNEGDCRGARESMRRESRGASACRNGGRHAGARGRNDFDSHGRVGAGVREAHGVAARGGWRRDAEEIRPLDGAGSLNGAPARRAASAGHDVRSIRQALHGTAGNGTGADQARKRNRARHRAGISTAMAGLVLKTGVAHRHRHGRAVRDGPRRHRRRLRGLRMKITLHARHRRVMTVVTVPAHVHVHRGARRSSGRLEPRRDSSVRSSRADARGARGCDGAGERQAHEQGGYDELIHRSPCAGRRHAGPAT